MKKIYLLILISFFTKSIHAQNYYPLLDSANHWQNVFNTVPVRLQAPTITSGPCNYPIYYFNILEHYTTQDTIINAITYKIVDATADLNPNSCHFGYIREDTASKKVYFLDNLGNPEILLYDFSMQIGNTIPINFVVSGYFVTGTFTLDSIRTTHINAGFRRVFYLNNHASPGSPTLPWIESVGSPFSPFYPYFVNNYSLNLFYNCPLFPHEAMEFLSCFDHISKIYYDSCAYQTAVANSCFNIQDTCNYHNICGSIDKFSAISSMDIFPNPSNGKCNVNVEVKQKDEFGILVWDISGKYLLKEIPVGKLEVGKKEIELNLASLSNGIYLIECKGLKGSAYGKILIEH